MRKATKRKVYALLNPIQHAIEGASLVSEERIRLVRLQELGAIDDFARDKAGISSWQHMSTMLNVCETMALEGIGSEALEACKKLQGVLIEAQQGYEATKLMKTNLQGIEAMRDVYEYVDLQRQSISLSTFERMISLMTKKLQSKAPCVVEL